MPTSTEKAVSDYYSIDNLLIEKSAVPTLPKISVDSNKVTASLDVKAGVESGVTISNDSALVIAAYKDNTLTGINYTVKNEENNTITAELDNVESGSVVKAMVLNSMTDIIPLMESVTANVQ